MACLGEYMNTHRSRITIDDVINLDYDGVASVITNFIRDAVERAGAKGVVVGVSGGVDSATTLTLAVKALGPDSVHALIMPDTRVTPQQDVNDAKDLVQMFGVSHYKVLTIDEAVDSILKTLPEADRVAVGNVRARIRMVLLYYYANANRLLVLGTSDRSEFLIGYFTKFGDGAADIYPIAVLYKSQVRRLAKHLGVPDKIAFKPSAPRLWPGHEAEKELGLTYEQIDLVLYAIFDLGLTIDEAVERTGLSREVVERVLKMYESTKHKRECFPAPKLEDVKRFWKTFQQG